MLLKKKNLPLILPEVPPKMKGMILSIFEDFGGELVAI